CPPAHRDRVSNTIDASHFTARNLRVSLEPLFAFARTDYGSRCGHCPSAPSHCRGRPLGSIGGPPRGVSLRLGPSRGVCRERGLDCPRRPAPRRPPPTRRRTRGLPLTRLAPAPF